jgi:hypothetical protein
MRGRWAAGIVPRNFIWIIQDRLAVSERPGGQTSQHRKVRRQEEIIWLKSQGFTRVVSLLSSPHNLHAYDERDLPSAHFALPNNGDPRDVLNALYPALLSWMKGGERVLLHQDELSERVSGVIAGFLCWCRVIPEPPNAIVAVEQLMKRQMGAAGRSIVAITAELTPPAPGSVPQTPPRPPGPVAHDDAATSADVVVESETKATASAASAKKPQKRVAKKSAANLSVVGSRASKTRPWTSRRAAWRTGSSTALSARHRLFLRHDSCGRKRRSR